MGRKKKPRRRTAPAKAVFSACNAITCGAPLEFPRADSTRRRAKAVMTRLLGPYKKHHPNRSI